MDRRFLVTTENGDVLVRVDGTKDGLDPNLLILEPATPETTADLASRTPLRAFGAKVVELIEMQGGAMPGGERMRRLMVQEKAAQDLNAIERFARRQASEAKDESGPQ